MTDKDITVLRRQTSRRTVLTIKIAIPAMILLNVIAGALNVRLSSRFATLAGTTFRDVIAQWFAGIDVNGQYSGLFIKATERWTTSLMQFTVAIIFTIMMAITLKRIARDRRTLAFINETRNEQTPAGDVLKAARDPQRSRERTT